MIDKFFGIVRRAYYLIAIIITLCAIIWGAIEVYSYHQEPRLQSWKFVEHKQPATKKVFGSFENLSDRTLESLASTNSVVRVELTSNTESVTVEIGGKFASMSRQAQDEDIREIADTVWPKKTSRMARDFYYHLFNSADSSPVALYCALGYLG